MNILRPYISNSIFLIILFSILCSHKIFGLDNPENKKYQEKVILHIGRDSYVAGESILFKAFCLEEVTYSMNNLSKVLYVELVDFQSKHVLGQMLKLTQGVASSSLEIPDTLSGGLYFIKAYTQWMRNFGSNTFFSSPVFIYNQYDDNHDKKYLNFSQYEPPKIYISGGKLIDGLRSKVVLSIPGYSSEKVSGKIIEIETGRNISDINLNDNGESVFEFVPDSKYTYTCEFGDSTSERVSIKLPKVNYAGYKLDIVEIDNKNIVIDIMNKNIFYGNLDLSLIVRGETVSHTTFKEVQGGVQRVVIPCQNIEKTIATVVLNNSIGSKLAGITLLFDQGQPLTIDGLKQSYEPREEMNLVLSLDKNTTINQMALSMDIYKPKPSITDDNIVLSSNLLNTSGSVSSNLLKLYENIFLVLPEINNDLPSGKTVPTVYQNRESMLPVEDKGIIYSGTVFDQTGQKPLEGMNVIFSLRDSIPDVQSSQTDAAGRFAFIVDIYGERQAYINVYKTNLLINNIKVSIDNKFYFSDYTTIDLVATQSADSSFIADMKDEAQRFTIQRVFDNNSKDTDSLFQTSSSVLPFYGKAQIVVYPEEFFFLPNFEEIAREILPRVRYKKSKSGCTITIFNSALGSNVPNPLVLLDGVTVLDYCQLYDLNSDNINRLEIQSDQRIAGNLLYDGLLAIYSQNNKKQKNGKHEETNSFHVLGYQNTVLFASLNTFDKLKSRSNRPDFKNQLYWNPDLSISKGADCIINLYTSDEEGEYVIDIFGITEQGIPVHTHGTFKVESD